METNAMNHNHAIKTQASVRYLLKEMRDEECSAFEEHYIGCRECSDEVKFGFEVAAAIRESAMTAVVPVPRPGLLARIVASVRQPAFAGAFALLLFISAGINVRQAGIIHDSRTAIALPAPPLKEAVKGGPVNVRTVQRNSAFVLPFLFDAQTEYVSYQGLLVADQKDSGNEGNGFQKSFSIPVEYAKDTVSVRLYSGDFKEGDYTLTILGIRQDGSNSKLAKYSFTLRFSN